MNAYKVLAFVLLVTFGCDTPKKVDSSSLKCKDEVTIMSGCGGAQKVQCEHPEHILTPYEKDQVLWTTCTCKGEANASHTGM